MPNMFGGDSSHPDYMPRKLGPYEAYVDGTYYVLEKSDDGEYIAIMVTIEGKRLWPMGTLPSQVKRKLTRLNKALKHKNEPKKNRGNSRRTGVRSRS